MNNLKKVQTTYIKHACTKFGKRVAWRISRSESTNGSMGPLLSKVNWYLR